MTVEEKLKKIYQIRGKIHPVNSLVITGMYEEVLNLKKILPGPDTEYIERLYSLFFGKTNEQV